MPRILHGSETVIRKDAGDIAAYLSTLKASDGRIPPPLPDSDSSSGEEFERINAGERLFGTPGCFNCHTLPGEDIEPGEDRWSLDWLRERWRPGALVRFLRKPGRDHGWVRMPDFGLTELEARGSRSFGRIITTVAASLRVMNGRYGEAHIGWIQKDESASLPRRLRWLDPRQGSWLPIRGPFSDPPAGIPGHRDLPGRCRTRESDSRNEQISGCPWRGSTLPIRR